MEKTKVSEIKSFFIFNFGFKFFGKILFPLSIIKVYADDGDSITFGLITILNRKKEAKC